MSKQQCWRTMPKQLYKCWSNIVSSSCCQNNFIQVEILYWALRLSKQLQTGWWNIACIELTVLMKPFLSSWCQNNFIKVDEILCWADDVKTTSYRLMKYCVELMMSKQLYKCWNTLSGWCQTTMKKGTNGGDVKTISHMLKKPTYTAKFISHLYPLLHHTHPTQIYMEKWYLNSLGDLYPSQQFSVMSWWVFGLNQN